MQQSLAILGRQPALGLVELESLFGSEAITPVGKAAALVDVSPSDIPFVRLGGSMKLAKVLNFLDTTNWDEISDYLIEHVPKHTCCIAEEGKLKFGLSVYGLHTNVKAMERTALSVKKVVKADGRSVRVVPNKSLDLNSAQVLHNQMTKSPLGMELLLVADGERTILAQTTNVQDIDAYASRDQQRPKRDARVGMLPPKLAQTIVNLAAGGLKTEERGLEMGSRAVLDPFCGTGVVLQEASLMGFSVYGSDLEERMIDYTHDNLVWLAQKPSTSLHGSDPDQIMCLLSVGDATSFKWEPFDVIAAETYLGRPFSTEPDSATLQQVMSDVNLIHKRFLQNLARQTKPGFRACLAVPAWFTHHGIKHLKLLDSLEELGYNRVSFVHGKASDLIYRRPDQVVGRELVVITRK